MLELYFKLGHQWHCVKFTSTLQFLLCSSQLEHFY